MYNITMFLNAWRKCPVDESYRYPWLIKAGAYLPLLMFKYLVAPEMGRALERMEKEKIKEVEKHKEIHRLIKEKSEPQTP